MNTLVDLVKKLDDAVLVMEPGRVAKGKAEIRDFFQFIFGMEVKAKQIKTNILEVGDIALFTSRWIAEGRTPDGNSFSNSFLITYKAQPFFPSSPRRRGSRGFARNWIPASAGMTFRGASIFLFLSVNYAYTI